MTGVAFPPAKPMLPRIKDRRGNRLPLRVQPAFSTADKLSTAVRSLQAQVTKLARCKGQPGTDLLDFEDVYNCAVYLKNLIDHWRPYMLCDECKGITPASGRCPKCDNRGWLPLAQADARIRNAYLRKLRQRELGAGKERTLANLRLKAKGLGLV